MPRQGNTKPVAAGGSPILRFRLQHCYGSLGGILDACEQPRRAGSLAKWRMGVVKREAHAGALIICQGQLFC